MTQFFTHKYEKGHVEVDHQRQASPIKLYYELHGCGPEKVVMIMGLSSPCSSWDNQIKFLVEIGRYTVLVFDNRGMGHSDSPLGLYSTSQMAQDALELLNYFNWKDNIHLVGMSLGGMISLEMTSIDTKRFRSLTLTSTSARRNLPTWAAISTLCRIILLLREPLDQLNAGLDLIYPKDWLNQKPKNNTEYATNREMAVHQYIKSHNRSRKQSLMGYLGQISACFRHYVSDERLKNIQTSGVDVMIITGTFDNLVSPHSSHHMKKILRDARFEVFEGSGHSIPDEQVDRYNHLLDEHFRFSSGKKRLY